MGVQNTITFDHPNPLICALKFNGFKRKEVECVVDT